MRSDARPRTASIETVLVVEDDVAIRRVAELALSRVGGWRVCVADDGKAALVVAARERPDVILLDVMLPNLDGPATLRQLRHNSATASIPVVFITARVQPHERLHYEELGAAGVIAKPFDAMQLPQQLRALVEDAAPHEPSAPDPSAAVAAGPHRLAARVQELVSAVETALDHDDAEARRTALRIAHQLSGSAGTFGAPRLGEHAGAVEQALRDGDEARARDALAAAVATMPPRAGEPDP